MRDNDVASEQPASLARIRWALFAVGLAASIVMALRAQFETDQYALLVRGWMWVREGWIVPFGSWTATGGFQPGGLTSVLMGLPLMVWEDYRAVGLFTIFTHVVAYWMLDQTLKDVLGPRERLLLCIVYWLNPWRVFYSAHIWNPNLIFLPAVLHLTTAFRSRRQASFAYSFGHVLAVGIALQLHASFLILAIASVLLFARGFLKVHWGGFAAGVAAVALSLVNWALAAFQHPAILPVNQGFLGSGLFKGLPLLGGIIYWFRYATAACSSKMTRFDFGPTLGDGWDALLTPLFSVIERICGPLALLIALMANIWLWRRPLGSLFGRFSRQVSSRDWLPGYARWMFIALVLAFALNPASESTPTTAGGATSWRGFVALHAAVLPVVLWLGTLWQTAAARKVRLGVACYALIVILIVFAMSIAAPMYRKGGDGLLLSVVGEHQEMFDALGIYEGTTLVIDPEIGFTSELFQGPGALERPAPFPKM